MDAAQTGNYNCQNTNDSAYGAGSYGSCTTTQSTNSAQAGAPNTGSFIGFVTSGSFSIILPLLLAIVFVLAATIAVARKKRATHK